MSMPGPPLPATKIVCTLGPASLERVDELVAAGMSVARLNLAHGTPAGHAAAVRAVRAAAERADRQVAILADLPGPKIRLGDLATGSIDLETGATFELRADERPGDATGAGTSHADLATDLLVGDRVLLADGTAELIVTEVRPDRLVTRVERGGTIRSGAGVGVPAERLSTPTVTPGDRALLPLVLELGVDLVGQSFVRSPDDVEELRAALGTDGPRIVAKIETRPAVRQAAGIAAVADALMVARGDLGVELPFEEVPLVQKQLVALAIAAERPVIVATQMLESMTQAPRPTRAEASDVANAVLDGTDAVMLSAETAIGRHPILAVEAAVRICRAAEAAGRRGPATPPALDPPAIAGAEVPSDARAIAVAAVALAGADADVEVLVCFTRTGRTARLLAALRPGVPILAVTPDARIARSLAVHRGITAHVAASPDGADAIGRLLRDVVLRVARATDPSRTSRAAVLVASTAGGAGGPNLVEVVRIG
jgi:pyruvate kinase